MKNVKYVSIIILVTLLFVLVAACNQDAIFYIISREVAPLKPRIEGAPTAMVVFEREYTIGGTAVPVPIMYVASSRLHWYARPKTDYDPAAVPAVPSMPKWDSADYQLRQPGGKIISLAATADYLYVLSITGSGTAMTLQRIGKPETDDWVTVSIGSGEYTKIQTIYTDSGRLFAGAGTANASSFALLYLDEAAAQLKVITGTDSNLLTGAAYDGTSHFLSTSGKGIYMVTESALASGSPASIQLGDTVDANKSKDNNFQGMIEIPNGASPPQIVAVERSGMLYEVTAAGFTEIQNLLDSSAKKTTGALTVYEDINGKMLLAGTRYDTSGTATSGYTNGYIELNFTSAGVIDSTSERHEPGKPVSGTSLTTVADHDRYAATLGKHSINHLFQVPAEIDAEQTLFAATQTAGLWSYRHRADGWQWNAEE